MLTHLSVGLGEIQISCNPHEVLVAYGLGSCIGVGLYDPRLHLAGLLHALLPTPPNGVVDQPAKYVDTGIAALLEGMLRGGADRNRLVVRFAGGANMLVAPGFSTALNIGTRNVDVAVATLQRFKFKVTGQEVGGNTGRTVRFYVADGRMTVRTFSNQEREI